MGFLGKSPESKSTKKTGRTLAILVPTDRFLSENLRQRTAAAGVALISLSDVVGLDDSGTFQALVAPLEVFAGALWPNGVLPGPSRGTLCSRLWPRWC